MKCLYNRLFYVFLSFLLVVSSLPMSISASENYGELEEETVERVYEEILTGSITNEEDVLKVALAQYAAQLRSTTTACDARSINSATGEEENSTPVISQVLEKTTDEHGVTTMLVADTGLLVTDANGESVSTDKLYNSSTGSLSKYSITATHTIYYYYRYTFNGLHFVDEQVKAYKMVTVLNYSGAYEATLLEHYYWRLGANGTNGGVRVGSYDEPIEATRYTTYPGNVTSVDWVDAYGDEWPGFGSVAKVYYGWEILEISIDINSITVSDSDGEW